MSISYTNHFKAVYDEIEAIIVAEFPRFKNRIKFKEINNKDLGKEDVIFLRPLLDDLEIEHTFGRISDYTLELIYLKKIYPQINYDEITDVGEHLKKLFGSENYRSHSTYWHYCDVISINYSLESLEGIENAYGFSMTLGIHKSEY